MDLNYDHSPNAFPIPQAVPAAKAPIMMVSGTDIYHFMPPTKLLASPSTPKKKAATIIVAITMLSSMVFIPMPFATIEGIIGVNPKILKLKKVTRLLVKGLYPPAISWSSSIIIIFKKPSLFLLRISTIQSETAGYSPIQLYKWTIQAFQASRSFSIQQRYRYSSFIMYSSSLLVPRQSATAIPNPSPIIEAIPRARTVLGVPPDPTEEIAMIKVVHSPSSPPQTDDFIYSPKALWCSSLPCGSTPYPPLSLFSLFPINKI